jgi:hypothetical protein
MLSLFLQCRFPVIMQKDMTNSERLAGGAGL